MPDKGKPLKRLVIKNLCGLLLIFCSISSFSFAADYKRIISLSPSITEILFALGAEDQVVGVTRFCKYPKEAQKKDSVGGYLDLNYKQVVRLSPDLVILYTENEKVIKFLKEMNIEYLTVKHSSLNDISDSIIAIGNKIGREPAALKLTISIKDKISKLKSINIQSSSIKSTSKKNTPKKVLIVIGKNIVNGDVVSVIAAGNSSYYSEIINLLGSENAYSGDIPYPTISAQGLNKISPDIIIDIVPDAALDAASEKNDFDPDESKLEILSSWEKILLNREGISNLVHIITDQYAVIPGPRVTLLMDKMAKIINKGNHQ